MDFKHGDKLLCISVDPAWSYPKIHLGKVYTYLGIDPIKAEWLNLQEHGRVGFLRKRFILYENMTKLEKILYNINQEDLCT